jgi:Lon-like ATP-dependent protease
MHPALRSRIRGYGYEVFVSSVMEDTASNREKLLQFVAQEVIRDGRIPHFTAEAAAEVIRDAQRRTGRTGKLTLRLRELGGLVRTAGDIARSAGHDLVTAEDVRGARRTSRSLEQQILEKEIQATLDSAAIRREEGTAVGVALGMAVVGTGEVGEPAGVLVPVEAAVVPALSRYGGAIVLGPGLKAKGTTVENVGAVLKTLKGEKIADHDIHVDARFAHKDADADGVGMAAAIAAISALESLPVRQDVAFVGDVAVNGALRPVRATLQRVEAAVSMGLRAVVVPAATASNLILDEETRRRIEIIPCDSLADVLNAGLEGSDAQRVSVVSRLTDHGIPR